MSYRSKPNKNNSSGYLGVNWSKEKGRWHAKIGVNYKRVHLGYFDDLNDAIQAYKNGKKKYLKG